ncbi:hypothetical protein P3T27_002150 [Kitasatospora sp. MAA19]|uniref:hypothetical protein n=1 Tax=Kitasatospora sp. MAA19 TaxID=3035090 RepID=UPI0024757992|nr:hypothetical protein [Kitasatospora sp. MAA19]MDH6705440.1 hypothetical protein [Kitasatospora sp. MAA19]
MLTHRPIRAVGLVAVGLALVTTAACSSSERPGAGPVPTESFTPKALAPEVPAARMVNSSAGAKGFASAVDAYKPQGCTDPASCGGQALSLGRMVGQINFSLKAEYLGDPYYQPLITESDQLSDILGRDFRPVAPETMQTQVWPALEKFKADLTSRGLIQ